VQWSQARHVSCVSKTVWGRPKPRGRCITGSLSSQLYALPGHTFSGLVLRLKLYGFSVPHRQPQMIQAKLLKADLHGALISGNLQRAQGHLDAPSGTPQQRLLVESPDPRTRVGEGPTPNPLRASACSLLAPPWPGILSRVPLIQSQGSSVSCNSPPKLTSVVRPSPFSTRCNLLVYRKLLILSLSKMELLFLLRSVLPWSPPSPSWLTQPLFILIQPPILGSVRVSLTYPYEHVLVPESKHHHLH
jgi:hypothetical protein